MNKEKPVAWIRSGDDQLSLVRGKDDGYMIWKPLYTTPQDQLDRIAELEKENNLLKEAYDIINNNINLHFPTKQTKPLSDEEIKEIIRKHRYEKDLTILCRAIERKVLGK